LKRPGGAEQRLTPEDERVEEVVVDPAVDDVHELQAASRAHVDDVLVADEVAPLHELDPHLAREKRVLVVGGVVDAGREEDDGQVFPRRGGGNRVEHGEELLRVMVDARHAVTLEQMGEGALHRRPVLEHVARPGRRAQVVFEHEVIALAVADHVHSRHVCVDPARRLDADHLSHEVPGPEQELARNLPVPHDALLVVDVVQEEVERLHPLDQAALEPVPLGAGNHARDQVEREDPLEPLLLSVDREADPLVHERELDRAPALLELLEAEPAELHGEGTIVRPRRSDRREHLVVEGAGIVELSEWRSGHGIEHGRRSGAATGTADRAAAAP
jgi:hypothetical protein